MSKFNYRKYQTKTAESDDSEVSRRYRRDHPYQVILYRVQEKAFIVMIICVITFFPLRAVSKVAAKFELYVLAVAAVIGFGIGTIWLGQDFFDFRSVYLQNLDREEKERREKLEKHPRTRHK